MPKERFRRIALKLYFGGLVLTPFVLLALPANFFDNGQTVCMSVLLFNQSCYGCGMTRAVQHLLHLDFSTAYELNKLSLIVLPLLVFIWFRELRRVYRSLVQVRKGG